LIAKKKFWENKKIFITGHTSFKGTWLKLWLEYLGAKVYGYSIDYPSNPKNLNKILFKEKFISQSILDFKRLKKNGFYVIEDADQFKLYKELNPTNEKLTPLKILRNMKNNKKFNSRYLLPNDVDYLKKNIKKYYFDKGKSIVSGHNISDIIFLKKK